MEASVAAPAAQGAPAPVQPPAGGQGGQQGQSTGGQGGTGFNWGNFPNVPEGQRELLEPHLRQISGYTTQLEQAQAPYRDLMSRVSPDQVQNLLGFLSQYENDPVNTWMGLAQSLKDEGHITNPAFDVSQLQQMVAMQQQEAQQGQGGQPAQGDMPPWAQQMAAELGAMKQAEQARVSAQEEESQQQALGQAHAGMRQTLVAAGLPEDSITTDMLNSALIASKGDPAGATSMLTNFRESVLRGFTQSNGSGPAAPRINGEVKAPEGTLRGKSGDGFREASVAAQQALMQSNAASAQG